MIKDEFPIIRDEADQYLHLFHQTGGVGKGEIIGECCRCSILLWFDPGLCQGHEV